MYRIIFLCWMLIASQAFANPYWDLKRVPRDNTFVKASYKQTTYTPKDVIQENKIDVLRIQVDWLDDAKTYKISKIVIEPSGTPALIKRSTIQPHWGSYLGVLNTKSNPSIKYYDAIGTGKEYRKLTRAITFRFPLPKETMLFEFFAENPTTGVMEKVISQDIYMSDMQALNEIPKVIVKEIKPAKKQPSLRVNIYAEGYLQNEQDLFFKAAIKTVEVLERENFPGIDSMSFYAVFHPSNKKLGPARDLGMPIPEIDSFLGLYYPYWLRFGRWYNVVYPTVENKLRTGLASAPYDYPIILINNSEYWGVGNYMMFTAIPAANSLFFSYLLLHEFGHFFGLNEEYYGGGRTELEFAEGMHEPWSQNITFFREPDHAHLKWNKFVDVKTKLPTPSYDWKSNPPNYGVYRGAYADSKSSAGPAYKPGLSCMMESGKKYCDICRTAIAEVEAYSLG